MLKDSLAKLGTYSIATIVQRLASFIMIPVYTRYLTPADYGVMSMLELIGTLFTLLVSNKLGYSLFYHWGRTEDPVKREAFVGNAFLGACMVGLLCMTVGWLTAPILGPAIVGVPEARFYLWFTFVSLGCSFPTDIGFSLMRIRNQATHYTIASILRLGIALALNVILLVFLHMGLLGMLISAVVTAVLVTGYMAFFVLRGLHFRLSREIGRELAGYSWPLIFSGMCGFVINSADRLFLSWYVPLSEIGIYLLAYRLGMLVVVAYGPVEIYWAAQMHTVLRRPEGAREFPRLLTYVVLYMAAFCLAMTVLVEPVGSIMIGPSFLACIKYVPWVALAGFLRVTAQMGRSAMWVEGKTKLEARITFIAALLCLGGYALLIPRFGPWGAVIATVIGFGTVLVLGQAYAQKIKPFHFEYVRLAQIAACTVLVIVAVRWMPLDGTLWKLATASLGLAVFPVLLVMTGFLRADERAALRQLWKRFRGVTVAV